MRRLPLACTLSAVAVVALTTVLRHGAAPRDRPYVIGIGAELMTQQAPQQAPGSVDRSMFDDPRGEQLDDPRDTAGKFPFYWTRAVYSGWGGRRGFGGGSWAVDFPKSDQQFLIVIKRLIRLQAYDWENPIRLSDPALRRFRSSTCSRSAA